MYAVLRRPPLTAVGAFSRPLRAFPTLRRLHMLPQVPVLALPAIKMNPALMDALLRNMPSGFDKFKLGKKSGQSTGDSSSSEGKNQNKSGGGGGGGGGSGGGGSGGGKGQNDWMYYAIAGASFVLLLYPLLQEMPSTATHTTFQEFVRDYLSKDLVEKVEVMENRAYVYIKNVRAPVLQFEIGSVDAFERGMENFQLDMGKQPLEFVPIRYRHAVKSVFMDVLLSLVPVLVVFLGIRYFTSGLMSGSGTGTSSRGSIFSMTKVNPLVAKDVKTSFKDVAGLDQAKVEIMEFVEFLKNPAKFQALGAKVPRGALLVGPPGTGKTLLAKAVAGEANVPFFTLSGSEFVEMFVGVGASRVRDLFARARKDAPSIIFIDEIDAVGRSRSGKRWGGGSEERENTLNQLLVEMDGFGTSENVIVLAGTNRADILDSALLRPGRFDRQILIDRPDIHGRQQIFKVHLKALKLNEDIDFIAQRMSALTPGFVGADIANICNEAAILAAREDLRSIGLKQFEAAVDRVIGGLEKKRVMSPHEKEIVAYHEAGHVVAGWFLEHADPVLKVTIIQRGVAGLGFAQYLPKELSLYNQKQIQDMMCMTFGGRASEKIFFGDVSTGAVNDLQKITEMAVSQVDTYGMNEKFGQVSFPRDDNQFGKPYSEETAQLRDREVRMIVEAAYKRTIELLEEKKDLVESLARELLTKETLSHDEITAILGERPFKNPAYLDFLTKSNETKPENYEKPMEDKAEDLSMSAAEPETNEADEETTQKS